MTKTKNAYLALVSVLLSPVAVNADIIDAGTYTTDEASGLDWLDMVFTDGSSYNQTVVDIGAGGSLEG